LFTQLETKGGINQGKRFQTFVTGVEGEFVKGYEFLGRMTWVVENENDATFLVTYDTPAIRWNAGITTTEQDVNVEIILSNKGGQQKFLQQATVYPHP
jgi:hypothetical protein